MVILVSSIVVASVDVLVSVALGSWVGTDGGQDNGETGDLQDGDHNINWMIT